jgi:hypothetical protein
MKHRRYRKSTRGAFGAWIPRATRVEGLTRSQRRKMLRAARRYRRLGDDATAGMFYAMIGVSPVLSSVDFRAAWGESDGKDGEDCPIADIIEIILAPRN